MRPVDLLVRTANRFESEITVERLSQRFDCRSYFALLGIGAEYGEELIVEAVGVDAAEAIAEIVALFESQFNETDET